MTDEEDGAVTAPSAAQRVVEDGVPPRVAQAWAEPILVARQEKLSIGIRLDRDLVEWFKGQGPGYQTRINAVLRRYVDAQKGPAR